MQNFSKSLRQLRWRKDRAVTSVDDDETAIFLPLLDLWGITFGCEIIHTKCLTKCIKEKVRNLSKFEIPTNQTCGKSKKTTHKLKKKGWKLGGFWRDGGDLGDKGFREKGEINE